MIKIENEHWNGIDKKWNSKNIIENDFQRTTVVIPLGLVMPID